MWTRRLVFPLLSVMLGALVALGTGELWALATPLPRIQVVTPVEMVRGVPTWHADPPRENLSCAQPRAVLFGSSILYGSGVEAEQSLGPHLEQALGGCIQNHAQPGYTFQNQWVVAQQVLARVQPDVVVVEVWRNSLNRFTVLDGVAYNFGPLAVDGSGLPNPFGLSEGLGRSLFAHSALYRLATVTRTQQRTEARDWREVLVGPGAELAAASKRLVWVLMPRLDRPFADSVGEYPTVREHAPGEVVDVAAALIEHDVEQLRADTCCHFNPQGLEVLAGVLAAALEPHSAPPRTPTPPPEPSALR